MRKTTKIIIYFSITVFCLAAGYGDQYKAGNVKIDVLDKDGLENLVKNRNGSILFLNIWATW